MKSTKRTPKLSAAMASTPDESRRDLLASNGNDAIDESVVAAETIVAEAPSA